MAPGIRLIAALIFLWGFGASPRANAAATDPDKDPETDKLLQEAVRLIQGQEPRAAIEKCEKVIAVFEAHYRNSKEKVYCARDSTEGYNLLNLGGNKEEGSGKMRFTGRCHNALLPSWVPGLNHRF